MTNHGNDGRGATRYFVQNPDGTQFAFRLRHSREKHALDTLIQSGATGCTAQEAHAPRLAASVLELRRKGVVILTEREKHCGDYPGTHARYSLVSVVKSAEGETLE
jgi:hypothetical protein